MNIVKRIARRQARFFVCMMIGPLMTILAAGVSAQTDPTIEGRVVDAKGGPLRGVDVVVRGTSRAATTGPDGRYTLEGVDTGEYRLIFSREDFNPVTRRVRVQPDGVTELDATLKRAVTAAERIVVTGTAQQTDTLSAAGDIDVIGGRDKRRIQGASLGDTLDSLAGVSNIGTGSQVGKPVIRGLSGNRVRVLKDGIGVNFQQFGVRHPPNIEPFLAERIEVVRGASSVLYGSDAIGGAVNAIPYAIPAAAAGESLFSGMLMGEYRGANDQGTGALRLNAARGGFGVTGALLVRGAGNLEVPDVPTFPESGQPGAPNFSGELDHTDFDQLNGEIGIGYAGGWGDIEARYEHWESEQNFLLPPPQNLPNGLGIGQNLENDSFQVEATVDLGPRWTLKPKFAFVENLRQSNPAAIGDPERPQGSTRKFLPEDIVIDIERESYTARLEAGHAEIGPGLAGRIGVEFIHEDQFSRGVTALTPGGEVDNFALFAFENLHFGRWHLEFGARFDSREQDAQPGRTLDQSVIPTDPALRSQSYDVFSGAFGVNFRVTEELSLVANVDRGFRAPTLFELFVNGVHGGVAALQRGDPTLTEETSLNTDTGLRWRSDWLEVKANLYRNAIDDYIFLAGTGETTGSGLPIFQVDQQDATLYGGDISVSARLNEYIDVSGTYEKVEGEFDGSNDELPLLPADQFQIEASFRPGAWGPLQDTYFSAGVRHAADKQSAGLREPFGQFDNTPFGTASTDSYTLVDLGFGFTLPYGSGSSVQVDIGVENLFDEDYRDFLDTYKGYALSPGRDIWVKVNMPFEVR